MRKLLLTLLPTLALSAQAISIFEANNGDTISASISEKDLTRIEIEGQKIIKDYSSADVSKKITKPLGQIYLVPNSLATFSLFVVSDTGNTYNLKLTPSKNVHGDSILIRPKITPGARTKVANNLQFTSNSYIRNINYLMEVMYLDKDDDDQYNSKGIVKPIATYKGLDSVMLKSYTNDVLTGYVILVKNTSKAKILLSEAQFYSPHTLAVAIDNPELSVNGFSRIFIIQEAKRGS